MNDWVCPQDRACLLDRRRHYEQEHEEVGLGVENYELQAADYGRR